MFDLINLAFVIVIIALLGLLSSFWHQTDEELVAASSGTTGLVNLGLICFGGLLMFGMMLS